MLTDGKHHNHLDVKNLVSKPYEYQQVEHEYEDQGAKKAEDKGVEGESSLLGEDVALGEDVQGLPLNAAALPSVRPKQYDMNITASRKKLNPFLFCNHINMHICGEHLIIELHYWSYNLN